MDGGDFGPGVNVPPEALARVQSQTFDQIVRTLGLGDEKDDLQLDGGGPAAVAGDSTAVPAGAAQAVSVHVHTEMVGPRVLPPEKKRRGRPPKGQAAAPKPPPPVTTNEEEDVCFICFDGGSLVLCDRKGCPKAYHPACIKRDEAFFRSKSKWNCGWHICSVCEKASHHMCYTCTYSLCKGCTKSADYVPIRGNKGLCATCMKTIMLIENKDTGNPEMVQVDFDDITSWEYLFKVYWTCLKDSLSLTIDEVMQAKSRSRGVNKTDHQQPAPRNDNSSNGNLAPASENPEPNRPKEQHETPCHNTLSMDKVSSDNGLELAEPKGWATKELLELVAHMKNGDNSMLSPFEVQSLLLEYIKTNNLRDPRRKSQIICDSRLQNLFRKPRVGHIEMLKLLEYHFLIKEDDQNNGFIPAGSVEHVPSHVVTDQNVNGVKDMNRKRRARKKSEDKALQTNLEEFAAIDVHNISLMYLRRKVMENLLGDEQNFRDKVIGAIVRIRISSNDQGIDIFRLVQVAGVSKAAQPYKVGDKTTDLMLEVLNLNKKETVSIEAISDQEFSPEECKRLRQGIRFGLLKGFSVGEIQTKAIALQATRLNDVLEAERLRLNHLRDRANEKGRKKDLRECVEKLQRLQMPEERQRRLKEIPEVHADPKMNPSFESEEDVAVKQDESSRPKRSKLNNIGTQPVPPKGKDEQTKGASWSDEKRDAKQEIKITFSDLESNAATCSSKGAATVSTSETEKVWHYRDPNGKIQGPFDMVQLRKWSTTGYFPTDLRIWSGDEMNGSLLLFEAVKDQCPKSVQSCPKAAPSCPKPAQSLEKVSCSLNVGTASESGLSNAVNIDQAAAHLVTRLKSDELKSVLDQVSSAEIVQSSNDQMNASAEIVQPSNDQMNASAEIVQPSNDQMNASAEIVQPSNDQMNASAEIVQPSNGQMNASQSSGQNSRPFLLNLDLNQKDSNFISASVTTPPNDSVSEQPVDAVMPDLPSAPPNQNNGNLEIHVQDAVRSDLPGPTPQPMDVDYSTPQKEKEEPLLNAAPKQMDFVLPGSSEGAQLAEANQSGLPKISVPSAGPSWSISLGFGGSQLQEVGNEWSGFSPTIPKPSAVEGWLGLVSMDSAKATDILGGDQVTAPLMHNSGTHPGSNLNWQPIEFSTLAEESVSDLLAEVDAMESQSGLASPTSKGNDDMLDSCRNDCFSSIEELSPTQDAGKSDAVSSGEVVQFPSRSPPADDPGVDSRAAARHSHSATNSEEGEIRPEPGMDTRAQPEGMSPVPAARNRPGLEPLDTVGWSGMQGNLNMNMNMGWVGSPQGYQNWAGGAGMAAPWAANPNFNLGAYGGAMGWADSPRRYGGAGPWGGGYQAAEVGYGGGRGRSGWSGRQPHGAGGGGGSSSGGGGGYSRPPPKGQRVCKFYENGHCRKGSACDYLHP